MRGAKRDWPPVEKLESLLVEHGSQQAVADHLGVPATSLKNHLRRVRLQDDASQHVKTEAQVRSEAPAEWGDIRRLIEQRGLSPDEWLVTRTRINEWGGATCQQCESPVEPLKQLRVDLEPVTLAVLPARTDGWKPPRVQGRSTRGGELVAFLSDHHAPFHDEGLHAAACEWLRKHKPHRAVILGDLLDLDSVSRHRSNPEWSASVQECVNAGYRIVRDYVAASPGTDWSMLAGNHEDRLRNSILDNLKQVAHLTRAETDDQVLSIPYLLRLDELGVTWHGSQGEYHQHAIRVSPTLTARHGWIAKRGSGASALATLQAVRHHVVIGHTHRAGIVSHTHHSIDGEPETVHACEAGTMARIKGGLGYVPAAVPDWAAGFATAVLFEDGGVGFELARWDGRVLRWRDGTYAG